MIHDEKEFFEQEEAAKNDQNDSIEEIVEDTVQDTMQEPQSATGETNETEAENTAKDLLKEEKDKFIRLYAEFENYKKRTLKEKQDLQKTANKDLMLSLLPVLDDIDRAYKEMQKEPNQELIKGIDLIKNKLNHALSDKGLEIINVQPGEDLDTDKHEAITQIPVDDEALKNKVVDCIETGYALNDKIIRFAKVIMGQ